MVKKIFVEDVMDYKERSKTYADVLTHRSKCPNWNKGYCMDCGEFHKFKVLRTLENNSKIEVVKI